MGRQLHIVSLLSYVYLFRSQLSGEAIVMLVTNRSHELCTLSGDQILVMPEGGNINMEDIKRIFCEANFTVFLNELGAEFDISKVIDTVS